MRNTRVGLLFLVKMQAEAIILISAIMWSQEKVVKKAKPTNNNKTPKCYDQFLKIGFTCLEAVAPLRADRFLLTATSSGIPGTHSVIPVTSER